jgi:hypothetical protein
VADFASFESRKLDNEFGVTSTARSQAKALAFEILRGDIFYFQRQAKRIETS